MLEDALPLEKTLSMHNIVIHVRSVFDKNHNQATSITKTRL